MTEEATVDYEFGVYTARTFYISDSRLLPLRNLSNKKMKPANLSDRIRNTWRTANAEFICEFGHSKPSENCKCGLYSFKFAQEVAKQYGVISAHRVLGVVAPDGVSQRGSLGRRSERASLVALWVDSSYLQYNTLLEANYPTVRFFNSLQGLLDEYKEIDDGSGVEGYARNIPSYMYLLSISEFFHAVAADEREKLNKPTVEVD